MAETPNGARPVNENPVSSGVEGLDELMGGGFRRNRLYLLQGATGTGKTSFALQFAMAGAALGERVLYVTLSESEEELRDVAGSHGWSLDGIDLFELHPEEVGESNSGYTLFHPAEMELDQSMNRILRAIEDTQPARLVLDTLSGLDLIADDRLQHRRQVQLLRRKLRQCACTALVLDENISESSGEQIRILAHGVIALERLTSGYGVARRRLRFVKLRGKNYADTYHDLHIEPGGVVVYPRLLPHRPDVRMNAPHEGRLSSGDQALDAMLGGGLERGQSVLLMGPAGTGKSSVATQFAAAAARRGEKSLLFVADETHSAFVTRSDAIGLNVSEHIRSGHIKLESIPTAHISPGAFTHEVRSSVEQQGVSLVVFDGLSGYLSTMPEERYLGEHFQELLDYLNRAGVVCMFTTLQAGIIGAQLRPQIDLSSVADSILLLRYFEAEGEVRKAIAALKVRAGRHDLSIREMRVSGGGITVGAALKRFRGVLGGIPEIAEAYPGATDRDDD